MQQAAAFHRAAARLAVGGPLRELLLVLRPERLLALLLAVGVLLRALLREAVGVLHRGRPPAVVGALLPALLPGALPAHLPDLRPAAVMVLPAHLLDLRPVAVMVLPALRPAVVTVLQVLRLVAVMVLPALRPVAVMVLPDLRLVAATALPARRLAATVLLAHRLAATVLLAHRLDPGGAHLPDPVALRPAPSVAASFLLPVALARRPQARPAPGRPPRPLASVGTRSPRISSASA